MLGEKTLSFQLPPDHKKDVYPVVLPDNRVVARTEEELRGLPGGAAIIFQRRQMISASRILSSASRHDRISLLTDAMGRSGRFPAKFPSFALPANELVEVTLLGEPPRQLRARVRRQDGSVVWLDAGSTLRGGSAVKIVWRNTLLLGEVHCCAPGNHAYSLRVEIEHALYDSDMVSRLAQRILGESSAIMETAPELSNFGV